MTRIEAGDVAAVTLALPATVYGATSANCLTDLLCPAGVTVTQLAQGVPISGVVIVANRMKSAPLRFTTASAPSVRSK
jgi:recombination protein RecR